MKKITFSILLGLLWFWGSFAQIPIGTQDGTTSTMPIFSCWNYSYSQQLVYQSEINAQGQITSITYFYDVTTGGTDSSTDWTILMGHTPKTNFANENDWVQMGDLTEVFSGTVTFPAQGQQMTIEFDTPFTYNNTDNLVIAVDENQPGFNCSIYFGKTGDLGAARGIYTRSDSDNPDPNNPPAAFTTTNHISTMILGGIQQSCVAVTDVTISDITETGAIVTWVNTTTATDGYTVNVFTDGANPDTDTPVTSETVGEGIETVAVSGLNANTTYDVYVISDCGAGDTATTTVESFTTLPEGGCGAATLPYIMDFETATPPALPECTSSENVGTGNNWETTVYNDNGLSANVLIYTYDSNNAANAWFYTQGVALESGVNYQISYKFFGSEYWPEKMKVAYGTSPEASAMNEQLADYPSIGAAYNEMVSFTVAADGVYYFGFNVYSDADRNRLYLDDIKIIVAPTCPQPTELMATSFSHNSADLSWTAGGDETEWLVTYGEAGFDPTTGGQEATVNTDPTTTITGLDSNTTYDFYVTAICGASDESEMVGPVSATTVCEATELPYFLDFEEVTTPALPECTTTQNVGDGRNWATYSASGNGFNSKVLRYEYSTTYAADAWFYTQGLNLVAGTEYKISYKYGNNSTTKVESLKVAYGTSPNASAMTEELADYPTIGGGTPSTDEVTFTVDTDGVYYFGFNAYSAAFQYYLYVDNISIIVAPSCEMPTNLNADNFTTSTADLSWTAGGTETEWEVLYGEAGFDPTTEGTLVVVDTDPETTITGLEDGTIYEFYVTAICGEDDESEMAGPKQFTTLCTAATVPYVMDFETATTPNLPACTSRENLSEGNNWITTNLNGFGFDSQVLFYNWSSSNDANAWFYTQGVELEADTEYQISYLYGNDNTYGDTEKMKVAYGTYPEASAMTTQLADHPAINSGMATENTVTFTPPADGVYYFGFNAYSPAGNYRLYLDDINVAGNTVGINENEISNINYFPNPVKDNLTISAANSIDAITVYNLLGQTVMQAQPRSTNVVLDLSSLPTGTYVLKANAADSVSTFKVVKK
ncbi:T9SS type A sorting domain-containing protein [Aequorivita sp. H23M31]|uniref:T9SS type A sorting domain-containing protein n=1 Tax=Aequorivita ciconiae TaxID=2494375 RepID=A0A410G6M3_9FLAO|nr:fibronectin type III domain-containing protein [Aequorivita sp. H23M31]QAA82934.1 T9SS type A sorting domain-containing protein [Aequorivita sp. H23M31]